MRRDRAFLEDFAFTNNEYGSIVQTNYPGAHDQDYRQRVENLVKQSEEAWPKIPRYQYSQDEHDTWALISKVLIVLQDRYSCKAYLEGRDALELPMEQVPQLDEVSRRLEAGTGFMLAPVGGLLDKGEFMSMLRHKVMRCTPYIRHPTYPFFTPEPDIVHEIRGHAPMFMHKPFVDLFVEIGESAHAAVKAKDEETLNLIGLFYWYTVEYGLIHEDGEVKIFGAGNNGGVQDLLRSIDPTRERKAFSIEAIQQLSIDYDAPQEIFFVAESFEQITALAHDLGRMVKS